MMFFALIVLYFIGIFAANRLGQQKDAEIRNHLKSQVEAIARTINKDHIKALTFTGSDKIKPEFIQLCSQMRTYKNAVTIAYRTNDILIYSMVMRDSAIIFGPESIKEGDRYASPPGTVYKQPASSLIQLFRNGQALTVGPYTDEYSTFLSAFAPVFDPATGKVLLVIGMDIGFKEVQSAISQQSMLAYLCAILLICVLLFGSFLFAIPPKLLKKYGIPAEVFSVTTFGLALTFIIALALNKNGTKSRGEIFAQVSEPEAKSLCKSFMNLRDYQVTALIRYFDGAKVIDRQAFHALLAPMFRLSGSQTSIGWIIPVDDNEKGKIELKAREEGMNDFTIWQPDPTGKKVPVSRRSIYYPCWYFEPPDGNTPMLGYDFAYDPIVQQAIEKAIKTRLPAATDPIMLPMDEKKQQKILIFQPVFTGDPSNRKLQGFIVAIMSPEPFIKNAISSDNSETPQTIVDLYLLSSAKPSRPIACTLREKHTSNIENHNAFAQNLRDDRTVMYPVFVFGQTYLALIFPSPGSFSSFPVNAGWIAAAIGVLLTFLITMLTVLLTRRNESLTYQVEARTAELSKSEEKYRGFFNSSLVGVAITAPDGKWLYYNNKLCEMLGYSREELGKMTWSEITPSVDLEKEQAAYAKAFLKKEPVKIEKTYICRNGSLLDVSVSTGAVHNNDGSVAYFSSIIQDITQRKKAEELLKQSEAELRELNATKDKFFSIIAHDLRSPFNSFLGYTQIMVEELNTMTLEEIKTIVVSLRKSATNVYSLLENLLEWSMMQRGVFTHNPVSIHLPVSIKRNIELLQGSAQKKEIEIIYDIPEKMMVFADVHFLETVIRNLVSNALKFTQKGGKITISAKTSGNDFVEVSIRDTGIGMDRDLISKLFKLNEQTNRKGTEGEPTTGLGLLLCKEFVEKHGGKIWAESEAKSKTDGKGSIFYFTIPRGPEHEEKITVKHTVLNDDATNQTKNLKILIAEDDQSSELFIAKAINMFSKEIIKVRTGVEAVKACRNNPDIDLILMDIQMPEMDGYEATRQIRQLNKDVVIIAQTAYGLAGDREKAIEAGCTDYITKPLRVNLLRELIQTHFKNTGK